MASIHAPIRGQALSRSAARSLRSLRITAPHDGILVHERNWRGETPFVGDTVWPGQKIAEIPELSDLEAKVFVLEADGAGLEPGLGATVTIEGRPGEAHPAKVSRVEPLAKPRGWGSPVRYFEVQAVTSLTDWRVRFHEKSDQEAYGRLQTVSYRHL